ncbi:hypothetical protein B0H16DRAFT_1356984 [Mycena metata]|uniref:F-box domain-containing protein n=1 Tax=Mycena metata TaxID=1033252 RepID=A0AAD7KC83_9AGAR|nr:hypothetical protein B0H16DRAFT_1356984 [Mycena metata]
MKTQKEFNDVDISLAIIPFDQTPDAHLTEELGRLTLELNSAKDRLANHMSSIAFGRQVPVEVLEVIFRLCLPQTDYIVPDSKEAPLVLCRVCSAWRKVALVTPRLWCSLSLHLGRRPGAWKTFLESWLGRSGQLPLSLSIESDPTVQVYQYFNDHIVKLLLKHAKRWHRLRLDVPSSSLTKLLNASFPLLEHLEIDARNPFPGLFFSASDAPRLQRFSLISGMSNPSSLHVPWDRLTHFDAPNYPFQRQECFSMLAKYQNLTRCTIHISSVTPTTATQQNLPPLLKRLCCLVLIGAIYEDSVTLFIEQMKLKLPSLESLELVNLRPGPFFRPDSPIFELGRQSNLKRLRLAGGRPLDGLFDTVVAIPSLREVYLEKDDLGSPSIPVPYAIQEALDMRISTGVN